MTQQLAQGRAPASARRSSARRLRPQRSRRWHERSTMDRRISELPQVKSGERLKPCPGRDEEE